MAKNVLSLLVLLIFHQLVHCQQPDKDSPNQSNLPDSTNLYRDALNKAILNDDWAGQIELYYQIGHEHFTNHEYEPALDLFLKIDSISQIHEIYTPATIKSIIDRAEISRTTFARESSDYAYLLLQEALSQAEKIRSDESIHLTYIYLADASGLKGEYEQAKEYIDLALEYFLANDSKENESNIARLYLINTGYYNVMKRFDKSEESFLNGIAYTRNKKNHIELAKLLYYYGYFQKRRLNSCQDALVTLEESKKIFDSLKITDTPNYERLNRDLADCNFEFGNYQKASEYYLTAYNLKSDLVKKANRELSRSVETKYQTEKKEQEIALLNSEKEVLDQKRINQRNLLLGGIGVTSLAGIFFFLLYRNRQKTNRKLREFDRLKSNFFANISHEFRTPLTLISGPVEKRLNSKKLSIKEREDFELIQRSSGRLVSLVDQLLDLSKLEAGKYQLKVGEGDLGTFVKALSESFQFPAREKQLQYDLEINGLNNVWYDADVIEKIVTNLLSNAIKYTDAQGEVRLKLIQKNGTAHLAIQNSPASIDPGSIKNLFDRFYQEDQHAEGAGIGLSLVKELTELMNGSIHVNKPKPDSLAFQINFPIIKKAFNEGELMSDGEIEAPVLTKPIPQPEKKEVQSSKLPLVSTEDDILLVVEDNADVRKLIRNSFTDQFTILEAANGKEGIEQAIMHIPDLIISDIMMPELDGLQLLEKLKNDERTSHIPIILLTAKAGEEDQYQGLSTGADAYVTKPFKLKLLQTRVAKLIESRNKLRKRYSQEVILKPKDIAITNLDEQFLERVQEVLDLKLTESDFNVQEFSDAVGMSRMQLHRKLKALIGLSASEFVRSQRLKLAASLLLKSDTNVSQIGYQVGFNDPSYFTRCFKEAYGVSPSEFAKKKS